MAAILACGVCGSGPTCVVMTLWREEWGRIYDTQGLCVVSTRLRGLQLVPYADETHARKRAFRCMGAPPTQVAPE